MTAVSFRPIDTGQHGHQPFRTCDTRQQWLPDRTGLHQTLRPNCPNLTVLLPYIAVTRSCVTSQHGYQTNQDSGSSPHGHQATGSNGTRPLDRPGPGITASKPTRSDTTHTPWYSASRTCCKILAIECSCGQQRYPPRKVPTMSSTIGKR